MKKNCCVRCVKMSLLNCRESKAKEMWFCMVGGTRDVIRGSSKRSKQVVCLLNAFESLMC